MRLGTVRHCLAVGPARCTSPAIEGAVPSNQPGTPSVRCIRLSRGTLSNDPTQHPASRAGRRDASRHVTGLAWPRPPAASSIGRDGTYVDAPRPGRPPPPSQAPWAPGPGAFLPFLRGDWHPIQIMDVPGRLHMPCLPPVRSDDDAVTRPPSPPARPPSCLYSPIEESNRAAAGVPSGSADAVKPAVFSADERQPPTMVQ